MDIKKRFEIFLFSLISSLFALPIVSAQLYYDASTIRYSIERGIDVFINFFAPFLEAILGGYTSGEFLFAKGMLLILLFVIIKAILGYTPILKDQKGPIILIAVIISIFAVRFISEEGLIAGILLPYGVLGVALATVLPFLLYFFFVNNSDFAGPGRKLMWIFFAIIFSVLWLYRADVIGPIGNQIYFWTMAAVVLSFVFDRKIKEYFLIAERNKTMEEIDTRAAIKLFNEYKDALDACNRGYGHACKLAERLKKRLEDHGIQVS